MAESEYEYFEANSSTDPASNYQDCWQIDRWLEQTRYNRAKAWIVFVLVILVLLFGIALLSAQEDFNHEQRMKVIHALNDGEWSEAVQSESLNFDTMPDQTEAFKAEQQAKRDRDELDQLKADVMELKTKVAKLIAER